MVNCEQSEILMQKHEGCTQAEILMLKHMEKTITPDEAARLAQHVQDCQSCREYYIAFDRAMEDMAGMAMHNIIIEETPANFTANVMSEVRKLPAYVTPAIATAREKGRAALYVFWGLSAAVVALVAFFVYNPHHLVNLSYQYAFFANIAAAIDRTGLALLRWTDSLVQNVGSFAINNSLAVAALAFALLLGMLLVVLQRDEEAKTSPA